ncbi:ABC transporter permease subunit [Breoghania sp.]|uniref:ABC transporter permease n=1 Tax=Breoghania sp. TaxID=2065378 RepID=UPI0026277FD3|nr:ABC transporter permease subunit [Breoghania sp.]MDJ0933508.1 ABC transporter permease subunit [Breoghania sp.]
MNIASLLSPKTEIPRSLYVGLSVASVLAVLCLWCLLTYGGYIPSDFLATPLQVLTAGVTRIEDLSLFEHMGSSLTDILSGFFFASLLAVPLGILMGSFRAAQAVLEPITGFMRYIPVSALIPLLILWIDIGIEQKVTEIFLGTFFQQLILISDVSARVSKDLTDCAYTLGANRRQHPASRLPARRDGQSARHDGMGVDLSGGRGTGRRQ